MPTKTKYLLAGGSDHLGSSVLVDGANLEVVKEFRYLGTVVQPWTIRAEVANALGVFERRILRILFGGVFEHGVWRSRMNRAS